jgi:sulfite reductase beta subunit-like hemoprotein
MLYREIIAVCSEIHIKHINTLCGQNVELLNVKPGGTYSNHSALRYRKFSKGPRIVKVSEHLLTSFE